MWTAPASGVTPTSYVLEGGVSPGETLASVPTGSAATAFTLCARRARSTFACTRWRLASGASASNEIRIFVNVPVPPSAPANLLGLVNNDSRAWPGPIRSPAVHRRD